MSIGIYKIKSPVGKIYIGQSRNIEKRFERYVSITRSQRLLRNSFKKHGVRNHKFFIVELCSENELDNKERYWQEFYNVLGKNGLNCSYQKCEGKKGKMRKESNIRNSKANKGRIPWNKGMIISESSAFSKEVLDTSTGIFYDSITKASIAIGMKSRTLNAMLTGQNPNRTNIVYV